jgi:hypothetical protein
MQSGSVEAIGYAIAARKSNCDLVGLAPTFAGIPSRVPGVRNVALVTRDSQRQAAARNADHWSKRFSTRDRTGCSIMSLYVAFRTNQNLRLPPPAVNIQSAPTRDPR